MMINRFSPNPLLAPKFAATFKLDDRLKSEELKKPLTQLGQELCDKSYAQYDSLRIEFDYFYSANRSTTGNSITFSNERTFPGQQIQPATIQPMVGVEVYYKEKPKDGEPIPETQEEKRLDIGGWHAYVCNRPFIGDISRDIYDAMNRLRSKGVQIQ
ncbi:MAG: hypothetical protein K2X66_03805 [Cyanobacteria bacterium]|nr:hypothetical protein [Cyanobacteriota bacterium]